MTTSTRDHSTQEPRPRLYSDFLERHDLATATGLRSALEEVDHSWARLSRRSGVPVSTLKSRGDRLGVGLTTEDRGSILEKDTDLFAELDEEYNRPILSSEQIAEIVGWVDSNFRYLLHEAPEAIERVTEDGEITREEAEEIICARAQRSLLHMVYRTHGIPQKMLWELEEQWRSEEMAESDEEEAA